MLAGLAAAVVYGVVHDQITVRISPEYLMDWHPEIVPSQDPTVVALAWGVVATWWFGLILGAVLSAAATLGKRPPAPWRWIVRDGGNLLRGGFRGHDRVWEQARVRAPASRRLWPGLR